MGTSPRRTLKWWAAVLRDGAFDRDILLQCDQLFPILLYTDATGTGGLGFAAYDEKAVLLACESARGPSRIKDKLIVREAQVTFW